MVKFQTCPKVPKLKTDGFKTYGYGFLTFCNNLKKYTVGPKGLGTLTWNKSLWSYVYLIDKNDPKHFLIKLTWVELSVFAPA